MNTTKKIIVLLFISFFMSNTSVKAQQEGFIGEVKMFAGNFAPRGWALCQGQLLPISSNTALFSILGTIYGGDGRTTFALPDLRGRAPIGQGNGPGLSTRRIGSIGGVEAVTLSINEIPAHSHATQVQVTTTVGRGEGTTQPQNNFIANGGSYATSATSGAILNGVSSSSVGGGQAHTNLQPFLTINYIISLQGLYPSRN